ncbi:MAG: hypothetical protein Q9223_003603 [Gallowayella weberi]
MLSTAAGDMLRPFLEQNPEASTSVTLFPEIECILKLRGIIFNLMGMTDEGAKTTLQEWTMRRLREERKDLNGNGLGLEEIFNEMVVREIKTAFASLDTTKVIPIAPLSPAAAAPASSTAMTMETTQPAAPLMMIVYQPTTSLVDGSQMNNFTLMHRNRLIVELQQLGREKFHWKQLYQFLSRDADESEYRSYVWWESEMQEKKEGAPKSAISVKGSRIPPPFPMEIALLATRLTLQRNKLLREAASQLLKEKALSPKPTPLTAPIVGQISRPTSDNTSQSSSFQNDGAF